jgi:hypothetical protein
MIFFRQSNHDFAKARRICAKNEQHRAGWYYLPMCLVIRGRRTRPNPSIQIGGAVLPGSGESLMLHPDFQEVGMVADSNSQIAWHRAQIRKHRAALKQIETARHNFGEIAGSKTIAQSLKTVTELKRKIRDSERIIAAYEKQTRRPLTTDLQTLASAPWSRWNGSDSPDRR